MRRWRALALAGSLIIALVFPASAVADDIQLCRINASPGQWVSLGFPVAPERLVSYSKPKVLVIPFKLKDNPNYKFTTEFKKDYEDALANIAMFSNGKSVPEFVFLPPIETEFTNKTIEDLKANQQSANQAKDESRSTWGFVRKFIADHDSTIDFTGVTAVILEGSSTSYSSYIAEAMMMSSNDRGDPYFRAVQTNEGRIFNFSLFDQHSTASTITHEVMHLYGLTDLYGTGDGPGNLSLMASNEINLLSYEKWVLGWLLDSAVQCLSSVSPSNIYKFSFDYAKIDQILVIRAETGEDFIVETTEVNGQRYLAFYSLNNGARPPITIYQNGYQGQSRGTKIGDYTAIGTQLKSNKHTLLISSIDSTSITVHFVSSSLTSSTEFKDLVTKSADLRSKLGQESKSKVSAEADAKAAAELKAKQEADAKAAAELKAKQESDAKAASVLKAKADAASKKSTITCIKGKILKKVTAVNPKCPSGYKRK
jgi:M6 family metalloprotease-like protein